MYMRAIQECPKALFGSSVIAPFSELDRLLRVAGKRTEDGVVHKHFGIVWTEPQCVAESFPSVRSTPVELMDSGQGAVRGPRAGVELQGLPQIPESETLQLGSATGIILVHSRILV